MGKQAVGCLSSEFLAQTEERFESFLEKTKFSFQNVDICSRISHNDVDAVIDNIVSGNAFNYPADKLVEQMAVACIPLLKAMDTTALINVLAILSEHTGKQICLYSMMVQN